MAQTFSLACLSPWMKNVPSILVFLCPFPGHRAYDRLGVLQQRALVVLTMTDNLFSIGCVYLSSLISGPGVNHTLSIFIL